jgi:hypothetical protein
MGYSHCGHIAICIQVWHPHVTIYKGTPSNHEAVAKIRIDVIEVIESRGFSKDFLSKILAKTHEYQKLLLEAWNEIHEEEK